MRENTRCEVEEPMSTPTDRMQISSSPSSERPLLEKKIRPPSASPSVMLCPSLYAAEQNAGIEFELKHEVEQHPDHRAGSCGDRRSKPDRTPAANEQRQENVERH